jgi:predicted AAA+ superfamily ATPase
MISRYGILKEIGDIFSYFPVCGVIGARQIGKTTLALEYAKNSEKYSHAGLKVVRFI